MGFHYANEKKKFDHEWKRLRKEYADAGMSPSAIEAIHDYDWEAFLSRRTYENHTQPLPDAFLSGEVTEQGSKLFKKYSSLSAAFDEENFSGRYAWLSAIGDTDLSVKLERLSAQDLELLTLLVFEGFSQAEIAQKWGCTQQSVSWRMKKIKKLFK